ncbi:MAG: sulfurtransferase complex subunit TusD [Alteromonadaceae bacterium]|nr:sulfurtransferase complex subunit TusD [Alteromonadaceae bacterium]
MKQKLAVVVTTPPFSNLTATAIAYIEAALEEEITVVGVFFYQKGVLNASKHLVLASDEFQVIEQWKKLYITHNLPLHLCVTAAQKRGLSDESEVSNIHDFFTISGLGELVELSNMADRVVQL